MALAVTLHFDYDQTMDAELADASVSRVAAAIAEPARARMLCCLMDGHARTGTELAAVAEVGAATASVHLARLKAQHLVSVLAQGRHRYYSLESAHVAAALEALMVLGGKRPGRFVSSAPSRLCWARRCYDHMAGKLAVLLHDSLLARNWIAGDPSHGGYDLTALGSQEMCSLGVDVAALRAARRRLACACLDWSERRPHVGGAVGAALLKSAMQRKWVAKDLDSRALRVTKLGEREFLARFGVGTKS
jgi:DNA-binding transcriptional ArsR family regulator